MAPEKSTRPSQDAEILGWQSRIRIVVAAAAAVAVLLLFAGASPADATDFVDTVPFVLFTTVAYILLALLTAVVSYRDGVVPRWLISATVGSDVAFIFAITIAMSRPEYYDRVLILAFFALHLNTRHFGRAAAIATIGLTAVGYVALVQASIASGASLHMREEYWSLGAFLIGAALLMVEYGSIRDRIGNLVRLFGRAEQGDFTEAYDEAADHRPDAITRVGRAYNRVRGHLASMVLTDPLTGCVNRRGFDQALAREVARADRAGSGLALLALDLDHFKEVNDTHGHLTGDAVLREVGQLLCRAARAGDVVARTGGEEFAFILPDTTAAGAYQLASRLCESVRESVFTHGTHEVRLTVSIGVASHDAHEDTDASDVREILSARADEALYSAKRSGRDRVRAWSPRDEQVAFSTT